MLKCWNGKVENIDKVPLLERKREIVTAQARERQAHGQTAPGTTLVVNLPQALHDKTRDALAGELGVSGKTYDALRHRLA